MGWFGFGKKDTVAEIVKGRWEVFSYAYGDGMRAMVTFDLDAATEDCHAGHPHGRRVIFHSPPGLVMSNGLPTGPELARLNAMEDALVVELGRRAVDCRKLGHMLYGGMRDVLFQCEDPAAFDHGLTAWHRSADRGRVEVVACDGWRFFDETLAPKGVQWAWIENNRVVRRLVEAGTDRNAVHRLDHLFAGPPAALGEIARILAERELPGASRTADGLTLQQDLPLDVDLVTTWTERFRGVADCAGGEYVGWGTAVMRP